MAPKINKKTAPDLDASMAAAKAAAEKSASELVNFSFKYLQTDHEKFVCSAHDAGYYLEVFKRIKDVCTIKKMELMQSGSKALRFHKINWDDTTEDGFGFPNEEQVVDTPYQFSISSNEHGRVHGFFILTTFYIVWLDKNHALYS